MRYGKVTIYRQKGSRDWRWQMYAPNGRLIGASSEGYRGKSKAIYNLTQVTGLRLYSQDYPRGKTICMEIGFPR